MRIAVAADHGGYELKDEMVEELRSLGHEVLDLGTNGPDSVDYPEYGARVARSVRNGNVERGIAVCGTGIGMSIVANRYRGIRATLCHDRFTAEMARRHNDSNLLILGGRVTNLETAREILSTWLETPFDGGRHKRRVEKLDQAESSSSNSD